MKILLFLWMIVIPTVIMTASQCITFVNLMECRYPRKKTMIISVIFTTIVVCVYLCICLINGGQRTTELALLTLTLPSLLYFIFISKYHGLRFFTTYCLSDISIAAMDYLGFTFCIMIFGAAGNLWSFLIRDVLMLLAAFVVHFAVRPKYTAALNNLKKGWGLMLVVTLMAYILMSVLSVYPTTIDQRPKDALISVLVMIFIELSIVVMIYMISNMLTAQQQKEQQNLMNLRLQYAQKQYEAMSASIEQAKIIRHDVRHYYQVIRSMCDDHEYQKLSEYLKTDDLFVKNDQIHYCNNYVVNIILSHYSGLSQQSGVGFSCKAVLPEQLPLDSGVLTVLIGNALSNALEACEKIPTSESREIDIQVSLKQNTFLMQVQNTCKDAPQWKGDIPVSTRGYPHGLGTESMRRLCEEYGGQCKFDYKDNVFCLNIALPLRKTQDEITV